jgi:transposase
MSPWIVPDDLWDRLEPLLPQRERRFRYPGCWRRLQDWNEAGVWQRLHEVLRCPEFRGVR